MENQLEEIPYAVYVYEHKESIDWAYVTELAELHGPYFTEVEDTGGSHHVVIVTKEAITLSKAAEIWERDQQEEQE